MRLAFLGSSLLSSYWNGAATYYRGLIYALSKAGVRTTFYEPIAFGRQERRDIDPPSWAEVVVYEPTLESARTVCTQAATADVVVKASGIGVLDAEILEMVTHAHSPDKLTLFWDVDAPATLAELEADPAHPMRTCLPMLDGVLTYGGGDRIVDRYLSVGARRCVPVYNALDPATHFPVAAEAAYAADLSFLGNRLPDREERVHEFFFSAAQALPHRRFLLAGAGWESDCDLPANVTAIGHLPTGKHNAFNASARAVLNISRSSMASAGYSPATRVFEAAGAGACIITDHWDGIDQFLCPDTEILVACDGRDVAALIDRLDVATSQRIGAAARSRVLRAHTYDRRARQVLDVFAKWTAENAASIHPGRAA